MPTHYHDTALDECSLLDTTVLNMNRYNEEVQ